MFRWDSLWALNLAKATPVWAFLSMPFPSASIVFGWPICDNRHKKWKIRTILAINNCSMRQQALIDTREIWRARKLRKSSSRRIQMQLLVLEAFLNFPKCFITWLTHTWSMTQLFCCMISGEKYPPLIFKGRKTPPACKIGCCGTFALLKNLLSMNWIRTQNRPWNMIQSRRCVKEKQKIFYLSFSLERTSRPECLWCSGRRGPLRCALGELSFKQARPT